LYFFIIQGNIAELGDNVYQYGTRDQVDRFTRTTRAIANYAGREYSKEMRLFVKNQKENEPKELVVPDKEEANLLLTVLYRFCCPYIAPIFHDPLEPSFLVNCQVR
jgi:hypothetical protein